MNYLKAERLSSQMRERNDCAVKAVSILCDVPYKVAHKALQNEGRKNRGGSAEFWIRCAINALGFKIEAVQVSALTIATIESDIAVQKGFYFVMVRGHIASIVNGRVEDWTRGRRHKVLSVRQVTPNKTRKERKAMAKALFN
jgi:hypothetical protein